MTSVLVSAVEADPAWMSAKFADGPKLVAWLEAVGIYEKLAQSPRNARRFTLWRAPGSKAEFWTVDRLLIEGGLHVAVIDPDVWVPLNGNGRRAT